MPTPTLWTSGYALRAPMKLEDWRFQLKSSNLGKKEDRKFILPPLGLTFPQANGCGDQNLSRKLTFVPQEEKSVYSIR